MEKLKYSGAKRIPVVWFGDVSTAAGENVAVVSIEAISPDAEAKTNRYGNLFAAAPDMFDALALVWTTIDLDGDAALAVRNALDKAKSGTTDKLILGSLKNPGDTPFGGGRSGD